MRNKKTLLLLIGLAVVAIVLLVIALTSLTGSNTPQTPSPITPTSTTQGYTSPSPTPKTQAPVSYNNAASEKMLQNLKNRTPLSENDARVKKLLISSFGRSGIVHSHTDYTISYLSSADVIQVEILSSNVSLAKTEAINWLTAQGLSQESMCTLPIVFYLNYEVAQQLKNTNMLFSPLADSCI